MNKAIGVVAAVVMVTFSALAGCNPRAEEEPAGRDHQVEQDPSSSTVSSTLETPFLLVHLAVSSLGDGPNDTTDDGYDDDSRLRLGCWDVGGQVIIYVNGSPIDIHFKGSMIEPIYNLVEHGKNVIRFSGRHTSDLFVKVVALENTPPSYPLRAVYAKRRLSPTEDDVELSFDIPDALVPPSKFDVLPSDPKDREQLRSEVMEVISRMADAWKEHDGKRLFTLSFPLALDPPGEKRDTLWRNMEDVIETVNDRRYVLKTDLRDVKLLFGERTILAYSGVEPKLGMAYLFRAETDDEQVFVEKSLVFVKEKGIWTVR